MLKKQHYFILIAVVVLVAVLLKLPGQTAGKFKLAISGLFLPLFGLAASTHEATAKAATTMVSRAELIRQNEELRKRNDELQIALQQYAEVWRDNARLAEEMKRTRLFPWKVKMGRIISRDPANWWHSLQIDLGTRDGVRPNAPVMTPDGLVGRILTVGGSRSQVILLGDPNLRIAALIQTSSNSRDTNRETGVIMSSSSSPQENNMVDIGYLSGGSGVRPGQNVVTWGVTWNEGGAIPPGIQIGKIVDSRSKDYGLATEARVKLSANLSTLEEVWVLVE